MRIDAHQQFWRIANRQGRWPPPALAPIHRDFVPDDLLPELQRCRIAGTVLVQSLATMSDTEFTLELAMRHDFVLGVVGWIDLKSAGAPVYIAHLAQHPQDLGVQSGMKLVQLAAQLTHEHAQGLQAAAGRAQGAVGAVEGLNKLRERHGAMNGQGREQEQILCAELVQRVEAV